MASAETPPLGNDAAREIAAALRDAGASLVGFADLSPFPAEATRGLRAGVSIAKALDPAVVAGLRDGPTAAYRAEYERVNLRLARLSAAAADMLTVLGFRVATAPVTVRAVDDESLGTPLPHKSVATRAGLGWIGHSALLVTREHGAAVRLASVLTDAPLPVARPIARSRCGTCRRCVDACPARAVSGRPWTPGLPREAFFDARACRGEASRRASARGIDVTICGICIEACPWTRRYLRRAAAP